MCPVSSTTRSNSDSETSGDDRPVKKFTADDKQYFKKLIKKADSVSLPLILKHYNILIGPSNRKIICPFGNKHKNGRDNSPSFYYYPDTNTFWCFGCKTGTGCTDFVANLENISQVKAAYKILESYSSDVAVDDLESNIEINYSERLDIMMDFSNFIREFIQANLDDNYALTFIEKISFIFDKMNEKHTLDNNALKTLVVKLKLKVEQYKPCPQL